MFVCHMLSFCSAVISLLSIAARVRVCLLVCSSACFSQKVKTARRRAEVSGCLLGSVCDFFGNREYQTVRVCCCKIVSVCKGSVRVCLCVLVSVCVCLCLFVSVWVC